ncbi:acyl-CoA dehydrogenase [Bacillus sp. DTU_2020_1000418_1_SI_GHA_SEK_038]|uniref:acyl-CoA dehydrogenase n=1 Tax=Bacillus sp. DTU_2020_1000418_1_SI_GHA_SEK_038 TaxID=3077585 RepID=UPI0028E5E5E6|nr:acyl-CoA dehydrogenase [Bacillus sp. DTU_2020_1000418_1_SI_GHA_SEK_038]WNS75805.1 acyl-CoA dehydrogenase [Bacillus sp. DTU_2020_1000418_1_SI_GHA_SEK_038]
MNFESLLQTHLKPLVRKIDSEAHYPEDFLKAIGKEGLLSSKDLPKGERLSREVYLVKETAKVCMTTAFNIWCHLASLTYIRNTDNPFLKHEILPYLESGELLGGTGLSNPMKYYAGLESLHLKAKRSQDGFVVSGNLPAVSNLGKDHWFGIIAEVDERQRIMAFVPCSAEGLTLKEKREYMGVNGSATYSCAFNDVRIQEEWIIAERADEFILNIRPAFVLYQIPLGLGVTEASIKSIQKVCNKQGGCNQYLDIQTDELQIILNEMTKKTFQIAESPNISEKWNELLQLRLDAVNLTLKSVHACMLHQGGAGYLKNSDPARRLRESYFLVNLTPTVKHLQKMIQKNITLPL